MLYRTKKSFNVVFRFVPNVYKKRKNYHKAFRYISKKDKRSFININLILWNLRSIDVSQIQLKAILRTIYYVLKEKQYQHFDALMIFLQSILSDMNQIPDYTLEEENRSCCVNIINSFSDVPSLYPNIIIF